MPRQDFMYNLLYSVITNNLEIVHVGSYDIARKHGDRYLILEIKTGGYWNGDHKNNYHKFKLYQDDNKEVSEIEENGWKLRFSGPHEDIQYQYDCMNYFFRDKVRPEHEKTDSGRCSIKPETFVEALKKLRFYSKYNGYELANAHWNIEVLRVENENLKEEIKRLSSSLESCRNDLASIS